MALPITAIPVLTGEVAERFEAEAEKKYQKCLNRTEEEQQDVAEAYRTGMERLHKMLAKSKLI